MKEEKVVLARFEGPHNRPRHVSYSEGVVRLIFGGNPKRSKTEKDFFLLVRPAEEKQEKLTRIVSTWNSWAHSPERRVFADINKSLMRILNGQYVIGDTSPLGLRLEPKNGTKLQRSGFLKIVTEFQEEEGGVVKTAEEASIACLGRFSNGVVAAIVT